MSVPTASLEKLSVVDATVTTPQPAAEVDPKKRLKALKKKLRDIVELQAKNSIDLSTEQREKLDKKGLIEAEIASLSEFDN